MNVASVLEERKLRSSRTHLCIIESDALFNKENLNSFKLSLSTPTICFSPECKTLTKIPLALSNISSKT